ncbi:MAG: hypothetical protein ABIX01_02580 [Chitinophagaceae bacterium]
MDFITDHWGLILSAILIIAALVSGIKNVSKGNAKRKGLEDNYKEDLNVPPPKEHSEGKEGV